jgi:hypothetical protein
VSHKKIPIKYPNIPPNTEKKVAIRANLIHFNGLDRVIGKSNKSGGIGKKELSKKAIAPRNISAFGLADMSKILLYRFFKSIFIFIFISISTLMSAVLFV